MSEWQIAFCPWLKFEAEPFQFCGVWVTGFNHIKTHLNRSQNSQLNQVIRPYHEHFLKSGRRLNQANFNPLTYVIDPQNPFQAYKTNEIRSIHIANLFLYLCCFVQNEMGYYEGWGSYTSWSDWHLYIHNVKDPKWYAVRPRRLFGSILSAGLKWGHTAFTRPIESNKFEVTARIIRNDLIDAVNELHQQGKTRSYFYALKTFAEGTTDREHWSYEDDLPYQKDAFEQLSKALDPNKNYLKAICDAASKTGLKGKSYLNFIRAISVSPNYSSMVCTDPFNKPYSGDNSDKISELQKIGKKFSWLERFADELNEARNRITHEGFADEAKLKWPFISLAFIGSRLFSIAFRRMLEWETKFKFSDHDECEAFALCYYAKYSRKSMIRGAKYYRAAYSHCQRRKRIAVFTAEFKKYFKDQDKNN